MQTIRDLDLNNKKVFLRLDLNVPISKGKIKDSFRIKSAIPTIEFLLKNDAHIIVASHLGRPKKKDINFSLTPVAEFLAEKLNVEVVMIDNPASDAPKSLIKQTNSKKILMLENLRFNKGEVQNSSRLASKWASYTDVYINDAFGVSHRKHASIDAICTLVETKGMGLLMEHEINLLDKIRDPKRPFLALLGGAKINKIDLIKTLVEKIDVAIIGGKLAHIFLEASGIETHSSVLYKHKALAKDIINAFDVRDKTLLLPIDHIEAELNDLNADRVSKNITSGFRGFDIGPDTVTLYSDHIKKAATIFANGSMGMFEKKQFSEGTISLLKEISKSNAISIAGGGDLVHAAISNNIDIDLSTGGGAGLEYITKGTLAGLEALEKKA